MVRTTIVQLYIVCQLCPFLDHEGLPIFTHALVTFKMDYCNVIYMELPLKSIQKYQIAQKFCMVLRCCTLMSLFHKLHWLPLYFQLQFKMLVFNYKESAYLRNCLFPVTGTHPIRLSRRIVLQVPSIKVLHLWNPGVILSVWPQPYET